MDSVRKKVTHRPTLPSHIPSVTTPAAPKRQQSASEEKHRAKHPSLLHMSKIIRIAAIMILAATVCVILFVTWKAISVTHRISGTTFTIASPLHAIFTSDEDDLSMLREESNGRINIILLGKAGENNPGKNLTDTIIVISVDTRQKKVALLSLPRDLYTEIPRTKTFTKINTLYAYGLSADAGIAPIREAVEEITGLPLHYFLVIDFDGFTRIVDALGGINVSVEEDINDQRYPGPNYSYDPFVLSKGLHRMNGALALKYVRERHDDPRGDFGRAHRQQQVLQAMKDRAFSLRTILNPFTLNDILNSLTTHVYMDIRPDEIDNFLALAKTVDTQNITNVVVDAWRAESLLRVSHITTEDGRQMFILVPRVGNYSEIRDTAENIFDLRRLERRREEIVRENASVILINRSGAPALAQRVQRVLSNDLAIAHVLILPSDQKAPQQSSTTIAERRGGARLFTTDELLKRLPAQRATDEKSDILDVDDADIVIFLGNDIVPKYVYAEDSVEDLQKQERHGL